METKKILTDKELLEIKGLTDPELEQVREYERKGMNFMEAFLEYKKDKKNTLLGWFR